MLTRKELNKKISGVRRSTKAFRANIQMLLIECAAHAYVDGQTTPMAQLYDAANGADRLAMAKWAQTFGFSQAKADGKFGLIRKAVSEAAFEDGDALIEYLTEHATSWFDMGKTVSDIAKDVDLAVAIIALTKRCAKAKANGGKVTVEQIAVAAAFKELKAAC